MPISGELRGMSDHRPARNAIVAILGTPDRTEGSLDDPREREEDGVLFNEKWIYMDLHRDPAGAAMRTVYWMRYDFRGTAVRNSDCDEIQHQRGQYNEFAAAFPVHSALSEKCRT